MPWNWFKDAMIWQGEHTCKRCGTVQQWDLARHLCDDCLKQEDPAFWREKVAADERAAYDLMCELEKDWVPTRSHKAIAMSREGSFPFSSRQIFERDNYTCLYCGKDHLPKSDITLDHVVPLVDSKCLHVPWNVVTACRTCNCSKLDRPLSEWRGGEYEQRIMAYLRGLYPAKFGKRARLRRSPTCHK